jgi:hypothetical protein
MNIQKTIVAVLFVAIGVSLIWYGFSRPCEIDPISQKVNGNIEVEQPPQLDKLLCLSSDFYSMISLLVGTAMIFPGIAGLFKGLTEDAVNGKSKKKKR